MLGYNQPRDSLVYDVAPRPDAVRRCPCVRRLTVSASHAHEARQGLDQWATSKGPPLRGYRPKAARWVLDGIDRGESGLVC